MKQVVAIYRAEVFSPNSVDKDRAIMDAVTARLSDRGYAVKSVSEDNLTPDTQADIFLTMGRRQRTLDLLKAKEASGAVVINTAESVKACSRSTVDRLMRLNGIPAAPTEGSDGYWIKRGDAAAQSKADVVFARDEAERDTEIRRMRQRGIDEIVVTAHVKGDLIKFYGVLGTGFFRTFYPADDGISKFGDERINGASMHYPFSKVSLQRDAEHVARLTGTCVYGGDCIIRSDGTYAIIDFNDFPSFSRCREEAAEAITEQIERLKN